MATEHIICLTLDTDPDGLSGKTTNRNASAFKGLEYAESLPQQLADSFSQGVPITWFIRIDKQIEDFFGSSLYLMENYAGFWDGVKKSGHELAWHPHLYKQVKDTYQVSNNPQENCEYIEETWEEIVKNGFSFKSFRNGEGWHFPETIDTIEKLGIETDSTAMPGIKKPAPHPADWLSAPNRPYYPAPDNINLAGNKRKLLEIPMNTWKLKAPYDKEIKIRYIDPAVRGELFRMSVDELDISSFTDGLCVWTFIVHPDELLPDKKGDMLFAGSVQAYIDNVKYFKDKLEKNGRCTFATISEAGKQWRNKNAQ